MSKSKRITFTIGNLSKEIIIPIPISTINEITVSIKEPNTLSVTLANNNPAIVDVSTPASTLNVDDDGFLMTDEMIVATQNTKTWGTPTWNAMHLEASYYSENPSEKEKREKEKWYTNTIENIPCPRCRADALKWSAEHPVRDALENRNTLSTWVLKFHNYVNHKLEKRKWEMKEMCDNLGIINCPKDTSK